MKKLSAILLVDDDPSTNFLNEATLYPMQLADTILVAKNGREAIDLLQSDQLQPTAEQPVLILLDMAMPVMNGMDFLAAHGQLPAELQAATAIVVLAINMSSADLTRLNDYPIAGMVSKPLTPEKIQTVLRLHFPNHEALSGSR